jgi:hypothetical protein
MQYKIPIQIENEDPIIFNLSLRQLSIIIVWWWIWYSLFNSLVQQVWTEIAIIPSLFIFLFAILIAVFKYSEMTFTQFVLAFIRQKINYETRVWSKWVDSYSLIDIWYTSSSDNKIEKKIDFDNKIDKIKNIDNKINNI